MIILFIFVPEVVRVLRLRHRWLMFLWIPIGQVDDVSRRLDVNCGTGRLGAKKSEMVLDWSARASYVFTGTICFMS